MGNSWRSANNVVKCCWGCVPPKRYPGCGDHCPEYKKEKAERKRKQEAYKASQRPQITEHDFNKVRSCASRKPGKRGK